MNTRMNEHGVEVRVCCDTDMEYEVTFVRPHNDFRGWDEVLVCRICHKEIRMEE